jgi:hypothetical protein
MFEQDREKRWEHYRKRYGGGAAVTRPHQRGGE